jgi:hypothetical protein
LLFFATECVGMKKVSKHHDEEGYEDDIVGKVEGSSTSFSRSMAAWQHGSMAAWQHGSIPGYR